MSSLKRFFVMCVTNPLVIEGDEFRHAVSVLRIKEKEQVIICDNSGYEYLALVRKIDKKSFSCEILNKTLAETETKETVTLIAGYLKGDKTEIIVQKAVELGVKEIVVFSSDFSSGYVNENKLARLNRVSIEAAKQCKRAIAPPVIYAENFESALNYGKDKQNKLFACEFAEKGDCVLNQLTGSTAIVVGSEGGFSNNEFELAKEKGYKTVYLGKRILRAETACIVLTGIVMNALGELK